MGGAVGVAQPVFGEPGMMGGVDDGDGLSGDGGKRVLAVFGREDPEAARSALASDVGDQGLDEPHASVAREEAGIEDELRLGRRTEGRFDGRQRPVHQLLQAAPGHGTTVRGVCGEDDIPSGPDALRLGLERVEEEGVEVAAIRGQVQ